MTELVDKLRADLDTLSEQEVDDILKQLSDTETQQSIVTQLSDNPELLTEFTQNVDKFQKSRQQTDSVADKQSTPNLDPKSTDPKAMEGLMKQFQNLKMPKMPKGTKIDQSKLSELIKKMNVETQNLDPKERMRQKRLEMRRGRMTTLSRTYQDKKRDLEVEKKKAQSDVKRQKKTQKRKLKRLEQKMGTVTDIQCSEAQNRLSEDQYSGPDERNHDKNIVKLYKKQQTHESELVFSESESESD